MSGSSQHPLDERLREWASDRAAPAVDAAEARGRAALLVARARERSTARRRVRLLAVAAVLLVSAGLFLLNLPPAPELDAAPETLAASPEGSTAAPLETAAEPPTVRAPADAPLELLLGDDRVELAAGGALRLPAAGPDTTRVDLLSGAVTAEVEHRAPGESFVVVAADVEVRVVGTRFSVELDGDSVVVGVSDGTVDVSAGGGRWTVAAGSVLRWRGGEAEWAPRRASAPPSAQVSPPAPDLPVPETAQRFDLDDVLGRLLLGGDVEGAVDALRRRVDDEPTDRDAWAALAGALHRQGDREAALAAWLAAAELGGGLPARRARYEAASLLQENSDHAAAAEQLEEMLSGDSGALEADARVRLGSSLLALGREGDAQAEWRSVVQRFPGTTAASTAARLLVQPGG